MTVITIVAESVGLFKKNVFSNIRNDRFELWSVMSSMKIPQTFQKKKKEKKRRNKI